MLELPTADEIDALAMTTPSFEVRKYEFERGKERANLKYSPCKGQVVLVIAGEKGLVLSRAAATDRWGLPSGMIGACEDPADAPRRVARDLCGLGLRSLELAGMYDVTWHFSDVSVKRLHLVYAARTDDPVSASSMPGPQVEARFFEDPSEVELESDIVRDAILDCSEK